MAEDLLPASTEAPRCSDFARSIELLPAGSGLYLDRVVLVSVPLPWPKPALKHPLLEPAAGAFSASSVTTRLFADEPVAEGLRVEVFERSGGGVATFRWLLESEAIVESLALAIAGTEVGGLDSVTVAGANRDQELTDQPVFLVCTQGSHDTCCGTSGVALADQIAAQRPEYSLRRVSHTGGHRFSPTFLAFPEGRMWAFADLALVDRIATDSATADDHRSHARGWWGAKVGPSQVAECAVRAARATLPFVPPQIEPVETGDINRFQVAAADETFSVEVRVARHLPNISCEAPGGLPAKPGREFAWTIERTTDREDRDER